jgi:hypothetical protein
MSLWNHLLCETCWKKANPGRQAVIASSSGPDPCCRCGKKTGSGIYVRAKPETMTCKGQGPIHEGD